MLELMTVVKIGGKLFLKTRTGLGYLAIFTPELRLLNGVECWTGSCVWHGDDATASDVRDRVAELRKSGSL